MKIRKPNIKIGNKYDASLLDIDISCAGFVVKYPDEKKEKRKSVKKSNQIALL